MGTVTATVGLMFVTMGEGGLEEPFRLSVAVPAGWSGRGLNSSVVGDGNRLVCFFFGGSVKIGAA